MFLCERLVGRVEIEFNPDGGSILDPLQSTGTLLVRVEKMMNEGMPYLQMWRGVWVSFCKIAIVSFLSVRYKSNGLHCRMACTPSSPTLFSTPSVPKYLSS